MPPTPSRPASEILVSTDELSIGFSSQQVVARLPALQLRAGEIVFLLGRNGVGKTTLLRTLAGLLPAVKGTIRYRTRPIEQVSAVDRAQFRAVVFPTVSLAGPARVVDVVSLGRLPFADWKGKLSSVDEKVVDRALQETGSLAWRDRWMHELSDGERQRVYLSRALAQDPAVLLLDEPTAFVDLPQRVEVAKVLKRWTRSTGRAVLLSTHDLDLALATADRIWILEKDSPWKEGLPEELVLSGSLARVFESPDATIDRATGRLIWCQPGGKPIQVIGEGIRADWTARALMRVGYRIDSAASARVGVSPDQDVWTFSHEGATTQATSLADLVIELTGHYPPSGAGPTGTGHA